MRKRCSDREAGSYSFRRDALFVVSSCLFVLVAFLCVFGCRQPRPEQVAAPTFAPEDRVFVTSVEVTISCATSGATIRYTTDGSTPTSSHGQVYFGPVTLTDTTMIRARAFRDGMVDSEVAEATFTKAQMVQP